MEKYEEWDVTVPSIPPRSRLFHLEPIGIGTPYVESLTSYFIRLAEVHHVFPGMLMKKVVEPLVRDYSQQKGMRNYYRISGNRSNLLNAIGSPAIAMVHDLEQLTLRAGLRNLTLLNWAEVLSIRNLVRQVKAWCPICYQEWRTRGQIVYDPLLWVLEPVTMCMRHHCRLSTRCPHQGCQQSVPLLAWRSQAWVLCVLSTLAWDDLRYVLSLGIRSERGRSNVATMGNGQHRKLTGSNTYDRVTSSAETGA